MKIRLKAFTLVELMVVITIIVILSAFVAINLNSAKKRARDDKRISDTQLIGNALDQYAASNARIYPLGVAGGSDTTYDFAEISANNTGGSNLMALLGQYINPVPTEVSKTSGFKYVYVYREDGLKSAVIVQAFESGNSMCNVPANANNQSEALKEYIANYGTPCYYVSR